MMNFSDITVVLDATVQKLPKRIKYSNDRYTIGCDPEDNPDELLELGFSIFTVYDKILQRVVLKHTTRKTFEKFCESVLSTNELKSFYTISNKFIENGKPKTRASIRS